VFWNNSEGISLRYTRQAILDNLQVIYGPSTSPDDGVNINSVTRDILYRNLTVIGYRNGIVMPRRGYAIVEGGTFANRRDFLIESGLVADRYVSITGQKTSPGIFMSGGPLSRGIEGLLALDVVILNFGPFSNQRVYYTSQLPDAVPFSVPAEGVPDEYIGLTAQQLWDRYGKAIGGALAPSNAFTSPLVSGGVVGPAAQTSPTVTRARN
jgi:hypothetical protein